MTAREKKLLPVETVRVGVQKAWERLEAARLAELGELRAIRDFQDACPHPYEECVLSSTDAPAFMLCRICGARLPAFSVDSRA